MSKRKYRAEYVEAIAPRLRELWAQSITVEEIANTLGITRDAVWYARRWLNLEDRRPGGPRKPKTCVDPRYAMRECLRCGKYFESSHIGNRMCPQCLKHSAISYGIFG